VEEILLFNIFTDCR